MLDSGKGSSDLVSRFRVNVFRLHQRELHSDRPTFAAALRVALRQASEVILVGEMRGRETIELALQIADVPADADPAIGLHGPDI